VILDLLWPPHCSVYNTKLNLQSLQYKNPAVWVDLMGLHPVLEVEVHGMLASPPPILNSTVKILKSLFKNICGCILFDLTQPLTSRFNVLENDGNEVYLPIVYRNLPQICQFVATRAIFLLGAFNKILYHARITFWRNSEPPYQLEQSRTRMNRVLLK
jgi:hypothetical protein